MRQELRFACRALLRSRGYASAAVVALALGLGVNITVGAVAWGQRRLRAPDCRERLRMTAQAFRQPRRLQIQIAGSTAATWMIQTTRAEFDTPDFAIPAGASLLELTSLDGATPAGADPRRLSNAVYDAALVPQPRR